MTLREDFDLMAFVVPYPDLHLYETANSATTLTSSYSQAGPRPGLPVADDALSTLELVVTGAQDDNLVVHVLQGGSPGIDGDSVQLGYRYDTDTTAQIRGWSACNGVVGWDVIYWISGSPTTDGIDACTHPASQKVLVVYGDDGVAQADFAQYDPATATWTNVGTLANVTNIAMALCALPTGRILLYDYAGNVYRSDDIGDSWTIHARNTTSTNAGRARMAYSEGEMSLVLVSSGGTDLTQFASSDNASSFAEVGTIASFGDRHTLLTLPDGRMLLIYARDSDGFPCCRVLASPWEPISGASTVVIASLAVENLTATVDPDGLIWVYGTDNAAPQDLYCWVSNTGGENWGEFAFGAAKVSNLADCLRPLAAASSQGQVHLIHKWVGNTSTFDESVASLVLGGWSTAPYAPVVQTFPFDQRFLDRLGFGPHATLLTRLYVPIELPQNCGWTLTGTAGAGTQVTGRLDINTVAQVCSYELANGVDLQHGVVFGVRVVSGGTITARDIALTVNVDDGVVDAYRIDIQFTTTQFRVRDGKAAATLATVTVDTTAELEVLVSMVDNIGFVLYRRPYESVWTEAWSGALVSATPGGSPGVMFGHITNGTAHSKWRFVGTAAQAVFDWPATEVGRSVSSEPTPMHCEVTDGATVGRLSVIGGVGALAESYSVDAEHDYPAKAIHPQISPSPAAVWRTDDQSEQIRSWLLPDTSTLLYSEHQGILAFGCNFRTAYLESELAGWAIVATLDLADGFAGINYALSGSILIAGSGGVAAARYLKEGELAGGYAVVEVFGGTGQIARRIRWNTAGAWTSTTTVRQARVYLEDVTGSEDATGQCDLVWPSGIAINYAATVSLRSRFRIRIPANQITPYNWYEAGILVPGGLRAVTAPDWGSSREIRPQVSTRRSAYGTSRTRELGPPLREESFGWTGGVDLSQLQTNPTTADYIGISGQVPLAAAEDVPWFLEGLQLLTRSGEIPIGLVKALPAADTTITDRDLILWGRLASSISTDHELGNEGAEVVRPAIVAISEIR